MKTSITTTCMAFSIACLFLTSALLAHSTGWESIHPIAGDDYDYINDVAIDAQNNIIIGGRYKSTELDFEGITITTQNNVSSPFFLTDVFIAKYNENGQIMWAKSGGGRYGDNLTGLTTDIDGNIYFVGEFTSDTFLLDTFLLHKQIQSMQDIFVGKLNPAGTVLWLKSFGAVNSAYVNDICIDDSGNLYITGDYTGDSIDFDTIRIYQSGIYGGDVYLLKTDNSGNALKAKSIGGISSEYASCVKWHNGKVALAGTTYSGDFMIGDQSFESWGEWDCFVAFLNSDLNCQMVKSIGGRQGENIVDMAFFSNGDLAIAGSFRSDTLHIENFEFINETSGSDLRQDDIFIARYNSAGNLLLARSYGQLPNDYATSVLFSTAGDIFLGGNTVSPNLSFGSLEITHSQPGSGYSDYYMVKLNSAGDAVWIDLLYSDLDDEDLIIRYNSSGKIIVAGNYRGSTLTAGNLTVNNSGGSNGGYEPFIAILDATVSVRKFNNETVQAYPNPAHDLLYLRNIPRNNCGISIIDAGGHMVFSMPYTGDPIQVSSLQPGTYWIRLQYGENEQSILPFTKY
jgi:hypothetical protein